MVEIDKKQCKGCELCVASCKFEALTSGTERNAKGYIVPAHDAEKCTGCMMCELICPDLAITVVKER
jgi:2-oxoglutarate ferredoxin oxidoreductase subunit delta